MSGDVADEADSFLSGVHVDSPPVRKRRPARKKEEEVQVAPPREEREPPREREEPDDEEDEDEDGEPGPEAPLPRELPRPVDSAKTLAGMQSKWRIGEDPSFKIQVHRILPKFFPGTSTQAHGYLEEFITPVTEEDISKSFGGSTFQVRVLGPDPKGTPNGMKMYDSIRVELAGPPNPERLTRSVQAKIDAASGASAVPIYPGAAPPENPTLAAAAMKMASDFGERERAERHRAEDKASSGIETAKAMFAPVIEANTRRTEDVLKAEREKAAAERGFLEERLRDSRDDFKRLEARFEAMTNNGSPSVSDELTKIIPMLRGDGGSAAAAAAESAAKSSEVITRSILERHQTETESMHKQHQTMLDSMRTAHTGEMQSMRDAHAREIEAERGAGRSREDRIEASLKAEKEERRRDAEQYKRQADDRDEQWKQRLENNEINLKTMWESRVETQKSVLDAQISWMRSENEQLALRVRDLTQQVGNQGDIATQLAKMRDTRSMMKDVLGVDDSPPPPAAPSSGGIGLSGMGEAPGWVEALIEQFGPPIASAMMGQPPPQQQMQQQPQQQQAPQPQPGQVVQGPDGRPMVIVQTAEGLRMVPKDQFDAYQAQQRQHGTSRPASPRRGMLGGEQKPRRRSRPSDGIPVPNMAEGLPLKPRPWGEAVQPAMPQDTPAPAQQQTQTPVAAAPRPQQQRGGQMDRTQTMIANAVAKLVHDSIDAGDEPEEFVAKILSGKYPKEVIDALAAMEADEIIAGIRAVQPNSQGATPMGQRFVHEGLAALRAAL